MTINPDNSYSFQREDLRECVDFAYNYHMDPRKGARGRTNQGKREFGGELDEIVPGKLCEIAVTKFLEHYSNSNKKLKIDTDIYPPWDERAKSDPDVVNVIENGIKRNPNLFIEIKRITPSDMMVGIRKSQLDESEKQWRGDTLSDDKAFIIYAELFWIPQRASTEKSQSVTGSILKLLAKGDLFQKFSDYTSLRCKINHIYTVKELKESGRMFVKKEIIPKILFFEGNELRDKKGFYRLKSKKLRSGYKIIHHYKGENTLTPPYLSAGDSLEDSDFVIKKIKEYAECKFTGEFNLIEPNENKNHRQIIECLSNVQVRNKFFGNYDLPKSKEFKFNIENASGGEQRKNSDDLWMSINKARKLRTPKETNALLQQVGKEI